jgi:group I intron endonuclease
LTVYLITCLVNGKRYVGKTSGSVEQRWRSHIKHAMRSSNPSPQLICRAIRKYGLKNFKIESLIVCKTKEALNRLERAMIRAFNTRDSLIGYNVSKGGDGGIGHPPGVNHPMSGHRHSETTKQQMSKNHQGKCITDSHKSNCPCGACKARRGEQSGSANPMFGKSWGIPITSEKAKEIGLRNKGRKWSVEERAKRKSPPAQEVSLQKALL